MQGNSFAFHPLKQFCPPYTLTQCVHHVSWGEERKKGPAVGEVIQFSARDAVMLVVFGGGRQTLGSLSQFLTTRVSISVFHLSFEMIPSYNSFDQMAAKCVKTRYKPLLLSRRDGRFQTGFLFSFLFCMRAKSLFVFVRIGHFTSPLFPVALCVDFT